MIGKLNNIKEEFIAFLLALSVMVVNLTLAFFLTVNCSLFLINWNNSYISKIGIEKFRSDYLRLICYLDNPWSRKLQLRYIKTSCNGLAHFGDVHNYSVLVILVLVFCLFIVIALYSREVKLFEVWRVQNYLIMVSLFLIIMGTLILISFQSSFVEIHYLLFSNMNWVFDQKKDPIIRVLTSTFFYKCFIVFVLISGVLTLVEILLNGRLINRILPYHY